MRITEKLKDGYIPYKVYEDVESKFKNFAKFVRVLPADYFDRPSEHFILKDMYMPGDKKTFPDGGFEVYKNDGSIYNYNLDQVIVHPFVLGIRNLDITENIKEIKEKPIKTPGKKGRRPLSDEERVKREQAKLEKKGGKKGRPSKYTPEQREEIKNRIKTPKPKGRRKKTFNLK